MDPKKKPQPTKSKRWRWIGLAIFLIVAAAWGWHWFGNRPDPKIEAVRQQMQAVAKAPPEQRRQLWQQVRQQMDTLTPEQQRQLREQGRERMQQEMEKRAHDFFSLPPAQRTAALDKVIDEMEKYRKEREASRPRQTGQNNATPPRNNGPRNLDPQVQVARHVQRLNFGSPQTRAYFQLLQQRRQERGLPSFGGGPGGGRGPGR